MTIKTIGAAEARVQLREILDQIGADQQPVAITRFGKTVAWIVHPALMDALRKEGER